MSIFREVPPTAGFPLYWSDLFPLFKFGHDSAGLEEDFKKYLGVNFAKVTYSGTASFYFILEGLKEISPKKAVIIPAFVCPLVPLAIARAGLKVKVCDIQPDNFNFDYNTLEKLCAQGDVLAIVAVHLAGLAIDVDKLKNLAEKHGIFLIEDCAQSLGAQYKGKKIGTFGDFAFYSLCRGKGLTIYEGGVLITKNEAHAKIIEEKIEKKAKESPFSEAVKILELFGYALLYRPFGFWFIFRLPQVFWKLQGNKLKAAIEEFDQDFPLHRVSNLRKAIGHFSFHRLEERIKGQRQKASYYLEGLRGGKRSAGDRGAGLRKRDLSLSDFTFRPSTATQPLFGKT